MTQGSILYLGWTLRLVMIFCPVQIYVASATIQIFANNIVYVASGFCLGIDSFCIADKIPLGGFGRVSCHFNEDLSKVPQKDLNVYLYRVSDYEPELVVFYSWINGQLRTFTEPGYDSNSNLTDHLDILIYNATREHAGVYKCIVAPYTESYTKPCTLVIDEAHSHPMNTLVVTKLLVLSLSHFPYWKTSSASELANIVQDSMKAACDYRRKLCGQCTIPRMDYCIDQVYIFMSSGKNVDPESMSPSTDFSFKHREGKQSFCKAPSVAIGNRGMITCHFTEDLSIPPQKNLNVFFQRGSDTEEILVLLYIWKNGSPLIDYVPGYNCGGKLTDQLEITIDNTTKEHAGLYKCVVEPSKKHQVSPCTLQVMEEASADVTQNYTYIADVTQNYTYVVPIVLGCLVLLAAIIIIIIMEFCLWPQRWNNSLRTRQSASESEDSIAESESLQGNNRLGV